MHLKLQDFTVECFNHDVNQSHDPDDKHRRWSDYRQQVNRFMDDHLDRLQSRERAIVLGAGSLNDIDLKKLCDDFAEVVLSDIDTDSIQQGIGLFHLNQEQNKKVAIVRHNYAGDSSDSFFKSLEKLARHQASPQAITDYLSQAMTEMQPEILPDGQTFDLVISCPVYTQLIFTQLEVFLEILQTYGLYPMDELNHVLTAAHQAMGHLIRRYNNQLLSLVQPDGLVITLTDLLEIRSDDPALDELKKQLSQDELNEPAVRDFSEKHGLSLAWTGYEDLLGKIERVDSRYLIWPFDRKKEYLVCCLAGHPMS